ncbi:MAG: hypothetical protein Q9183_001699 [Haloplaca sp. 2 TL-2023]
MKPDGTREVRNDPDYIRMAMDRSLKRLQTNHIDLWYCHWLNGEVPIEIVVGAMAEQVKLDGLLQTCRELGIAVAAYSPLGRGMLTGQYRSRFDFEEGDWRRLAPRFSDENFLKNVELVDKLKVMADRKSATTGQLTLAWLMAQGPDIFPIPGTKRLKYLAENLGSLIVNLTEEEDRDIRRAVEAAETQGARYPANMMNFNFADTPPLK